MAPESSQDPIRAAGILITRRAGAERKLLLLRNRHRGEWGFPKGHLEPGEDAAAGAARELAEETGITEYRLEPGFRSVCRYAIRAGKRAGLPKEVTYFLAAVEHDDVTLSEEHDGFRWVSLAEAEELLPFEDLRALARSAVRFEAPPRP